MINIDLLTVIVIHPYIIVRRCNVASYVVGDVDCYRLRLSDASTSLPETHEALGIMAFDPHWRTESTCLSSL